MQNKLFIQIAFVLALSGAFFIKGYEYGKGRCEDRRSREILASKEQVIEDQKKITPLSNELEKLFQKKDQTIVELDKRLRDEIEKNKAYRECNAPPSGVQLYRQRRAPFTSASELHSSM